MKKKNKESFVETIKTIISAVMLALIIRTFAFEPFNIPSGSMLPTLLVGDYLFVSKYSYGYSKHSFPLSILPVSGRYFFSEPKRGDVAVFKLPSDNKTDYIKRIIGLPGDKVQLQNGRLFINEKIISRERVDDFIDDRSYGYINKQYSELLPNNYEHNILEFSDSNLFDNTREYTVPNDHYFMMGDNRDNSEDSRSQVGFVPKDNLVGRAEILFFSTNGNASIFEFWKWHKAIRFERIFDKIK